MIPTKNKHSNSSQIQKELDFREKDQSKENHQTSESYDFLKSTPVQNNIRKLILKAKNQIPAENDSSKLTSSQCFLQRFTEAPNKYKVTKVEEKSRNVINLQRIPRRILLDDKFLHETSLEKESLKNWQIIKKRNPHFWKFHLGNFSNKKRETTLKVLTIAMRLPKKLRDKWSGSADANLYYLNSGLKRFSCLRNLDLNLQGVSSEGVKFLCDGVKVKRLTSLQNFSIRFKDSKISDEEIERLGHCLKRFPRLKGLNLGFIGCEEIPHEGLKWLGNHLKRLRSLENLRFELSSCDNIPDSAIYVLKELLKELVSLRNLSLNFSDLETMTNQGMEYLEEILKDHGKNLRTIDFRFDWCPNITNRGLIDLSQGIKHLTFLEEIHLYFSEWSEIGGLGINAISRVLKGLRNLKRIDLNLDGAEGDYFCREALESLNLKVSLGDQELQHLGQNLLESFPFQSLNLCFSNCGKKLTDVGLKDFGKRLSKFIVLENLDLKFMNCEGVTNEGFLGMCEDLQSLNSLQNFCLSVGKPSSFQIDRVCKILNNCSMLKSFCLDCDFKQRIVYRRMEILESSD